MSYFFLIITFLLSLLGSIHPLQAKTSPTVFVSILPQQYFVQQIAKDKLNIQVMVKPGESPATYEPSPLQMKALSKAKGYFSIGVPFEFKWLPKISALYPHLNIIHTDKGIQKMPIHQHSHEKKIHDASHFIPDPHIWLSPPLVKVQILNILLFLKKLEPDHQQFFESNYHEFLSSISQLDKELNKMLTPLKHKSFMVFHPSWGYFAQAYGLKQIPIEIEGKDVKPWHLKELILKAKKNRIRVIFAQPQFSSKSASLIAREIGGQVLFIDPLALDWEHNLKNVGLKVQKNLK